MKLLAPAIALCFILSASASPRVDNSDYELRLLLSHSDLVVLGRAVSQPKPTGMYNHFALDYTFKFHATQTLEGTRRMPRDLDVALNFPSWVRHDKPRPVFPIRVGPPYILFLFNNQGKQTK